MSAGQWPMRPDFWPKWPANLDINDIYMGIISIFVSDKYPYCVLLYQSGQCIWPMGVLKWPADMDLIICL